MSEAETKRHSWRVDDPDQYEGRKVGNGQCVAFVREASGLPPTASWRAGHHARAAEPGTVIATFDADRTYGNHVDGRSHAAVLCAVQSGGLLVWDQWLGKPVGQRLIRFRNSGPAVDDGAAYCVVLAA